MSMLPILYKRASTGAPQQWQIFVDGDSFYTEAGQVGGAITRSKPTTCRPKNVGRSNETTVEEQALSEAKSRHQKKLDSGYVDSLEKIDDKPKFFKPMLAKDFKEHKKKIDWSAGCAVQPKYDGIRAVITKDGATTRNGKRHMSIPHILAALEPLFKADPSMVLDGEVYNHAFHDDFNEITSIVRKTKPTSEDLKKSEQYAQFFCYDAPVIGSLGMKDSFMSRWTVMAHALNKFSPYIKVVPIRVVKSEAEVYEVHDALVAEGYEGVIIRVMDAPYLQKRSDQLLKYKEFEDDEFTILDVLRGEGNKSEMAGSVAMVSKSGHAFTSNLKFPHAKLIDILKNKEKYIGRVCTVRYFGLTPSKKKPRFPYVIDIGRWDHE